ncbi:tetratricopeptide repeat protein [Vibrio harveyi]|uniref:tetratricopeptide repeat protein n=1 Tax=Vibrio harveyi TaxID=669 RepID=UPI003909C1E9
MRFTALLYLAFLSFTTHAQVDIETFEQYQKLSRFLERDDFEINAFARFHDNHQGSNAETQELTKSLYLQACLKLEMLSCALDRTNELLTLTRNSANREQLLRLAVQLNYQNQRYLDVLSQFAVWQKLYQSELEKGQVKLTDSLIAEVSTIAGHSAYQLEKWQETATIMKAAVKLDATQQRYQLLLASYQRLEAFEKEYALLLKVTELYPNQDKFWSRLAQSHIHYGQNAKAVASLLVVKDLHKLTEPQRILLAQLQLETKTPALAYHTLSEYTPSSEYQEKVNKLKLHALLKSRQRDQAIKLLDSLSQASSLAIKAQLAYSEQRWEQAVPLLKQQIKQQPENQRWQLLKAIAHFELHQYRQAKPLLESLLGGKFDSSAKQWLIQIDYLNSD